MEEMRRQIASNLVYLRKKSGMTQQGLAEKLNYSDKAVSKWERGDGLPDVFVLKQIANMYGVTVDDVMTKDLSKSKIIKLAGKFKIDKRLLIAMLLSLCVLLVATIVTVVLLLAFPTLTFEVAKYSYLSAVIVSLCIFAVFFAILRKHWPLFVCASAVIWLACLLVSLALAHLQIDALIFLFGALVQLLIAVLFMFFIVRKNHKTNG